MRRSDTDWRTRAACRDVDVDRLFFPGNNPSAAAAGICRRCPVLVTCTFDALRSNLDGVFAGMTKTERDRVRAWDKRMREAS